MKRAYEITLGLSSMFGINNIDNDVATHIVSFCDAQSKYTLRCTSHRFKELSSYNNLSNILGHNQNALTQKEKEYALLRATQRSDHKSVERLLAGGTNPNAENRIHLSPLTIAKNNNDEPMIQLLQQHKCVVNPQYKPLPTFISAMYTKDVTKLQQCINDKQFNPHYTYVMPCSENRPNCHGYSENIFHLAAYIGDANILTLLIQPTLSKEINEGNNHFPDNTPFWIAADRNYIAFMETLITHPKIDINKINNNNSLYFTAEFNHIKIAKILLNNPTINVNYLFKKKFTPLCMAADQGHTTMV